MITMSFFLLFFAATVYATVILIQLGGWLAILAGLLLICSYFVLGPLGILGYVSIMEERSKKKKEEEK